MTSLHPQQVERRLIIQAFFDDFSSQVYLFEDSEAMRFSSYQL